jgi:hypothetical protein
LKPYQFKNIPSIRTRLRCSVRIENEEDLLQKEDKRC